MTDAWRDGFSIDYDAITSVSVAERILERRRASGALGHDYAELMSALGELTAQHAAM